MYDDVNDCFIHTHAGKSSHTLVKYNRVKKHVNVIVIQYHFSKHLYMYIRLFRSFVSVDLSSHKESDLQ